MPFTNPNLTLSASTVNLTELMKPVPTDSSGSPPPENSEVRKIAEDVAGALKFSLAAVAANPDVSVRPDSVEAIFKQAIRAMPASKQEQYKKTAADLIGASESVRISMFGRAGHRDVESHLGVGGFERYTDGLAPLQIDRKLLGVRLPTITVPRGTLRPTREGLLIPRATLGRDFENVDSDFEAQRKTAEESNVFNTEKIAEIWGETYTSDPFQGALAEDQFEELAITDKMGFWVRKVKCVDETNPEWWGSDEIALAGVSVDEDGDTKKISERYIGGGFDDGDSKWYSNWRYHWFSMRESAHWPKTYAVSLILAEKDNGGLASFLNTLWANVRAKVKAEIEKAVTGALSGWVGPVIANAIAKAVAWVIDILIGWIINLFNDDIFPPFTAMVTTPSMSARWHYPNGTWGNPSSGIRTAHFYGYGGHYYVQYFWKFYS